MSIHLVYRAESVGPICRRLAQLDDRIRAIHEDELREDAVLSRPIQAPPPPIDPLLAIWGRAQQGAAVFAQLNPDRVPGTEAQISRLVSELMEAQAALRIPALVAPPVPVPEHQIVVRWGSRWEGRADAVINSAEAVSIARDKRESRRILSGICPTTWTLRGQIQVPCVIRPRRHHAANKFFVCRTAADIDLAIRRCGPGWYASQLIDKDHEYRVFVLQGRVVCVSERFPADSSAVAWNLAAGGRLINVKRKSWPIVACNASILAARRVGLDWTAVDVVTDASGRALVLEVNTAPGLKNPYTMEQIAWALGSVAETPTLPALTASAADWQTLIHPSLVSTGDAS